MSEIAVSGVLLNILLYLCVTGLFIWIIAGIQALVQNSRDEKRREERFKRERERTNRELQYFDEKLKTLK